MKDTMQMTTADFKEGDEVRYIPTHADGDAAHEDCENGIVSSVNSKYVFVKYFYKWGGLGIHAKATRPEDLIKMEINMNE